MEREAEHKALAKAWSYLSFRPGAKWATLLAAAGTGLFYVALLIVLGLFADLMVYRGQVPAYRDLTAAAPGDSFSKTGSSCPGGTPELPA